MTPRLAIFFYTAHWGGENEGGNFLEDVDRRRNVGQAPSPVHPHVRRSERRWKHKHGA